MAKVYTVAQVSSYIKSIFSRDVAFARITVRGEVSNCRYLDAGTVYFTLKDEQAAISCVLFQSNRAGLTFRLQNGQKIDASGQISVYEKTGVYQLYVRTAVLAGAGELYEQFLKLKEKLAEMGMFDAVYKKPIPVHADRIGIVTAEGGAAIQDIIRVSRQKNPYVKLYLRPALVQGQYAAQDIAEAIRFLDSLHLDVLIVGRGGGSAEDLWAFNEEAVAKAIFDCATPVISAVGHETDFTIADFVADLRAATPTQAAELANYDFAAFEEQLSACRQQLNRIMNYRIQSKRKQLAEAHVRLEKYSPESRFSQLKERAGNYRTRLEYQIADRRDKAQQKKEQLEMMLRAAMERKQTAVRHRMSVLAGRFESASPLKKISGGFGYLMSGGRAVRRTAQVKPGDEITVYLSDGMIRGNVTGVTESAAGRRNRKEQ